MCLAENRFPLAVLHGTSPGRLLIFACIGLIIVHLGSGGLTLLHNYTAIGVGQSMVNDLRGALYAHLQRLSLAFHDRQRVGDLLYRITADSFAVQTMIMNGVLPILSAAVLLAGMLMVLFPLDPNLTLLALTVVPVLFALIAGSTARSSTSPPRCAPPKAGSIRWCNGRCRRSRSCRPLPAKTTSTAGLWAPAARAYAPPCAFTAGKPCIRGQSTASLPPAPHLSCTPERER